jgi:hypothetical protein
MADTDMDLGSAGPVLLPDQPGPHRHLLLQPSKDKRIFVLDRDSLGKFHANTDAVVQTQPVKGGGYGAMAYWNGQAYYVGEDDALREYAVTNGELKPGDVSSMKFDGGATPSLSANGNKDAIVWVASKKEGRGRIRQAVLYGFDAAKIGQPIYSSETNDARDGAGMAARFVIPVVVDGRVYLGTRSEVDVYGLLK